ncbi:MAG: AAA family ATPase, partial [Cyanobacteria bacterium P01_E01_bin.42]
RYALIMEDFGGISLDEARGNGQFSSLTIPQFLQIAIQLAEILHHLHRNCVIHKDIKPANILIHPETQQIKLIDFSISSLLPKETQTIQTPNSLEGTLAYISPEQTGRMNRGIDYRSDFYSLGVTFYELLNGKLPFESNDPLELVHCHIAKTAAPLANQGDIPKVTASIVMKLMAKNAEDRYQSALGLKYDLEKCLSLWQETGTIEEFELGERDRCDRFLIPEKLYGREKEVQTLLEAFDRVAAGTTEMMLVAGFSGIGKTAVVNEIHKPIVRQQGYFIKGKFDQFQRNVPFSAFVQAFRDLMGQLLNERDARLKTWKTQILHALGENARVIIEVIPELEGIIGKQPSVPELSGTAAQNRFNLLFQKFIRVFTTPEHPLVIFVDDLQWADSASLKLMEVLMGDANIGYLLLLGAYRDNEVFAAHPLMLTLNDITKLEANLNTITLASLSQEDLDRLVADTLSCQLELASPLTELLYQKTQGNPFFATQFLKSLHEDGWIAFNFDFGYWQCDMARVKELALTDNVVEFMATRLYKLPEKTREILQLAACIGNQFDLGTMAIVSEQSRLEVAQSLWGALQERLILPVSETYKFFQGANPEGKASAEEISVVYKFLHDRVQQAAYSLIPDNQKPIAHYRIGQLLLQKIPPEAREERIFELVGQLNYGIALMTEQTERDELAQLNLIACRKARATTAYQAGRDYASTGLSLLGENPWARQYEMSLAFHDNLAELASLCGDFEAMEQFVEAVIARAHSLLERVNACRIRILSNLYQNRQTEAVALGIQLLQQLGIAFPETPTEKDIQQVVAEIEQLIGDRAIEDLVDLPMMTDREKIAMIQIANSLHGAAYISGSSLFPLLIILPVKLSIQYGNISASAYSYAAYGLLACNLLQDINKGVDFGQLGLNLVSKLDTKTVKPEVFNAIATYTIYRKSHLKETLPLLQEGYKYALEVGNLEFVGYTAHQFCLYSFWCGQPLATLEQETRAYYHTLLQLSQLTTANYCRIHWQATLNLLGATEDSSVLSGEATLEEELLSNHDLSGLCFFYSYQLMLCYLFGEIEAAQTHAVESRRYLIAATGMVNVPVFYLYDSLTALATFSSASEGTSEAFDRVEQNQTKLQQQWARYASMNHQHKVDLVEAEKCRVLGQKVEAIEFYDRAIYGAKENDYIQEEALANELAAKFFLDWGKEKVAAGYLQEAYYCYSQWEAKAKIEDLEQRYPILLAPILEKSKLALTPSATAASMTKGTLSKTTAGAGAMLDLVSLMKASRTLSEEISLEGAIANLMKVTKKNAGAETVALMLFQEEVLMLSAILKEEDTLQSDPIPVEASNAMPMTIVNKVKRSRKALVLNNASNENAYAGDAYILSSQPKSILCLPLADRGKLIGILYLENNQVAGAFTSDRIEILNLLCSQAAITLHNAQLYDKEQQALTDLQQAQLQLVQNEKMATLGNLVAGVAHEINNPVGFISGNVDAAREYLHDLLKILSFYQENTSPPKRIAEAIEDLDADFIVEDFPKLIASMQNGCDRIRSISTSLRTFSRTDTDNKTEFNLHEGLDSTLLILKYRLKANEERPAIEIMKKYGEIPNVKCYAGQLNQVFMNLLANAIDALDESNEGKTFEEIEKAPNRITISTQFNRDKSNVIVRITDNGKGMSEMVKAKIFEQGFTTKGVGKGTGLGMAIAHQIITENHGGAIACRSEAGEGTEFIISLPLD